MNDYDRLQQLRPPYARDGYVHPDPAYPEGRFVTAVGGEDVEVEYDTDGEDVILTAVWSGKWNVLDLLDDADRREAQADAETHAWDL